MLHQFHAHYGRIALLAALTSVAAACERGGERQQPEAASEAARAVDPETALPNVILISLDTLRADRLGVYGYDRPTTPNLDAFAESATRYARAYTTSSWTLPTHASMLTGLHPAEHGVIRHRNPEGGVEHPSIPEDLFTVPEIFDALGYDSAAYVANQAFVTPAYGMMRGIGQISVIWMPGDQLVNRANRWLEMEREAPFFLFLNFMDTHYPYNTRPVRGLLPEPPSQEADLILDLVAAVLTEETPTPEDLRQAVIDQYDTAVANLDKALGKLFEQLEALDLMDNTHIVITSDHGEVFGSWDIAEHGKGLYEPLIQAVMIVRKPGQNEGAVVEDIVSSVDVPHLILDGLPEEAAAPFREHYPHRIGEHPITAESHYAIDHIIEHPEWGERFDRGLIMWLEWPWKYIHATDGAHELFHLEEDPGEKDNRIDREPERAAAMARALEQWRAPRFRDLRESIMVVPTGDDLDAMEALGYL